MHAADLPRLTNTVQFCLSDLFWLFCIVCKTKQKSKSRNKCFHKWWKKKGLETVFFFKVWSFKKSFRVGRFLFKIPWSSRLVDATYGEDIVSPMDGSTGWLTREDDARQSRPTRTHSTKACHRTCSVQWQSGWQVYKAQPNIASDIGWPVHVGLQDELFFFLLSIPWYCTPTTKWLLRKLPFLLR